MVLCVSQDERDVKQNECQIDFRVQICFHRIPPHACKPLTGLTLRLCKKMERAEISRTIDSAIDVANRQHDGLFRKGECCVNGYLHSISGARWGAAEGCCGSAT